MRRQNSNSSETWDVYHNIENNIRSKLTRKFADIVMNSISKLVQETTHPKMKIQLIDINPYVAWKTGKFYFGNKKFLHFCSKPFPPPPTPLHWATSCEEGGGKGCWLDWLLLFVVVLVMSSSTHLKHKVPNTLLSALRLDELLTFSFWHQHFLLDSLGFRTLIPFCLYVLLFNNDVLEWHTLQVLLDL